MSWVVKVWRAVLGKEGDHVGDPLSDIARGVLGDLGGRDMCGLKRKMVVGL